MRKQGDLFTDTIKAYQSFFESDDGKVVLYDLMERGRMFTSTLGSTPMETSRNEGQREMVVYILEQVGRDIEAIHEFTEQQKESKKEYLL